MTREEELSRLKKLRNAIISKKDTEDTISECQAKLEKAKKELVSTENWLKNPSVSKCTTNANRVKKEYEAPHYQAVLAVAKKHDRALTVWRMLGLIIVTAVVASGTAVIAYLAALWSWNTSILSMIGKSYFDTPITYNMAVGVHLSALAIVLIVFSLIMVGIGGSEGYGYVFFAIFGILGLVSSIASFSYFYAEATGFWSTLGYFLLSGFMIFKFIGSFLRVLVFMLAFVAFLGGTIGMIYFCYYVATEHKINSVWARWREYNLDYEPLYKSNEYKAALKEDEKDTNELLNLRIASNKKLAESLKQQVELHNASLAKYRSLLATYTSQINNATYINKVYKNVKSLNEIIWYIDMNRANDIAGALNQKQEDEYRAAKLKAIKESVEEQRRQHEREMQAIAAAREEQRIMLAQMRADEEARAERLEREAEKERERNRRFAERESEYARMYQSEVLGNMRLSQEYQRASLQAMKDLYYKN